LKLAIFVLEEVLLLPTLELRYEEMERGLIQLLLTETTGILTAEMVAAALVVRRLVGLDLEVQQLLLTFVVQSEETERKW
jgi:hypothetical protein